jgi:hypothetical protein
MKNDELTRGFADRLLEITEGCREDMHEPDEQDLSASVVGNHLDNAFGEDIDEGQMGRGSQEFVVFLERNGMYSKFNLATLIAFAREGAQRYSKKYIKKELKK